MDLGRPKAISTPEIMWQHFVGYKKYVSENPIKKHVFVGKDGNADYQLIDRPLTYEGFCNYLENENVINNPIHYFMNYEDRYKDFITICLRIRREIRNEQIEKGMAGIYNPSITQRLNGLVEKSEVENTVKVCNVTMNLNGNEDKLLPS